MLRRGAAARGGLEVSPAPRPPGALTPPPPPLVQVPLNKNCGKGRELVSLVERQISPKSS